MKKSHIVINAFDTHVVTVCGKFPPSVEAAMPGGPPCLTCKRKWTDEQKAANEYWKARDRAEYYGREANELRKKIPRRISSQTTQDERESTKENKNG